MGKGGTKFEGEAIGVRGKAKTALTGKEMRRNMCAPATLLDRCFAVREAS
jgi:hypothetical protein